MEPPHLVVARVAHEEDLPLQSVHNQLCPERASSTLCPPLLTGMIGLTLFAVRFRLPSMPANRSAFFRWAAMAFHLAASESRYGWCRQLLAACVAIPIHFALVFAAVNAVCPPAYVVLRYPVECINAVTPNSDDSLFGNPTQARRQAVKPKSRQEDKIRY